MAMAIVQGNCGFPFFAKSTYDYLCDVPIGSIDVDEAEVPSYEARTLIEKVWFIIIIILFFIPIFEVGAKCKRW